MMGSISFDFNFWTLTLLLLNFALALFVAFSNRQKVASDELKAVKSSLQVDIQHISQQVVDQGQRLAAIEADVENGITKEDLSAVYERINVVVQVTGPMQGQLGELSKSIDRIDQHLMQLLHHRRISDD